jgi:CRISPR-associated protein Cmr4
MYQNTTLYRIENLTNMHVGSGEANFGTVDRLIQRDAVTGYPIIHASSLKGALKEYVSVVHNPDEATNFIRQTFGDEELSGNVRFGDAWLLAVPMRAKGQPYFMCTSPDAITHLLELSALLDVPVPNADELKAVAEYTGDQIVTKTGNNYIESYETIRHDALDANVFDALEQLIGTPAAVVPHELFSDLLKNLPVIARNQLENGESKNLWYEEVLPRKSRMFTFVSVPEHLHKEDQKIENHFKRLHQYLQDKTPIQIGANASIGYGMCRFDAIVSTPQKEDEDA